jgi:hypothetical protein
MIGSILTGFASFLCFFESFLFQLATPKLLLRRSVTVEKDRREESSPALRMLLPRPP